MKLKALSLIACCVSFALQAEVAHKPSNGIKIGERSTISGTLDNTKAIKEARLYFKSNLSDSFIFVELDKNGRVLQSDLPAPGPSMGQIDYFFAIKYQDGSFERSDVFATKVNGEWDEDSKKAYSDILEVQSELDPSKVTTEDFANNVTYGFQAARLLGGNGSAMNLSTFGGYTAVVSSGAGSTAAAAGGTAAATTAGSGAAAGGFAGLSMTTIGIGAAAVGVGAVAAGSSSSDNIEEEDEETSVIVGEGENETEVTGNDNTTGDTGTPLVDLPGLGNVLDANGYETHLPPSNASCGTLIYGSGNIPEELTVNIDMGTNTGNFSIDYFLGGMIADQLIFEHEGVTLLDTSCTATPAGNTNSGLIALPGAGSTMLEVVIHSNCLAQTGTYWEFTVSCPL